MLIKSSYKLIYGAGVVLVLIFYFWLGSNLTEQINNTDQNILGADQKNNMKLAHWAWADRQAPGIFEKLPHVTDGVVSPLWPWMASFLDGAEVNPQSPSEVSETDRKLFNEGRSLYQKCTVVFLLVLSFLLFRLFSWQSALLILSLTAFVVFQKRILYFQPEPLLYMCFLGAWISSLQFLKGSSYLWALATGCLCGLSYLTKSSAILFLYILVAFYLVMAVIKVVEKKATIGRSLVSLLVVVLSFVIVCTPKFIESHKQFGEINHSYPSYWMWMDNFDDGFKWMQEHPNEESLEKDENKPSLSLYLSQNGIGEFSSRVTAGSIQTLDRFFFPRKTLRGSKEKKPWKNVIENRGLPLLVGSVFLGFLVCVRRKAVKREEYIMGLFILAVFVLYTLAYGFYAPVGKGDRFMLLLYAPVLLCTYWACETLVTRIKNKKISLLWNTIVALLLVGVGWRMIEIVSFPIFYQS